MPFREGTKSGEHYMICGVQGDFTRSLVEDPPKYIWTRQLKVRELISASEQPADETTFCLRPRMVVSLLVCQIRQLCISEESEFAPGRGLARRFQPVSRCVGSIGKAVSLPSSPQSDRAANRLIVVFRHRVQTGS